MNTSNSNSEAAFVPSGSLEIHDAEALRQSLAERLGSGLELLVDLKDVTACDTAGAQLLVAAAKTAGAASKKIRFANVPPVVTDLWQRLGLPANFFTNPICIP